MRLISVDTETTSLDAFEARVTHASWCYKDGDATAINWKNKPRRIQLIRMLEDPNYVKIFYNAKYDWRVLHNAGVRIRGPVWDALVMAQMCVESYMHGLKQMTMELMGESYVEQVELKQWMRKNKLPLHEAPNEIILPYAKKDARCTMGCALILMQLLKKRKLIRIFLREMLLMRKCVIPMESRGVMIDIPHCKELAREALQNRNSRARAMRAMVADPDLNPNSFRQMGKYIFADQAEKNRIQVETGEKFKAAKCKRTTATGYPSTDNFAMRQASTPLSRLLLDWRLYKDAYTKYLKGTLDLADEHGVVHGDFKQHGARTGRFSCAEPNLTNVPKDPRTFMGKIRKIFIARKDHVLVFMDYDQIEIKLAADASGQEYMLDAIRQNQDLHGLSAKKYFGVTIKSQEFKLMRDVAKRQNYAMLYGAQAYRLHRTLIEEAGIRIPLATCEEYVEKYWETNDKIAELKTKLEKEVAETGGIRNPYGRYITIPVGFEYVAINALIQSTAADIIKIAMLRCARILRGTRSHMIIMVHDELIFEIHKSELRLIPLLKKAMEEMKLFSIPITCSLKWGANWLEKKVYNLEKVG